MSGATGPLNFMRARGGVVAEEHFFDFDDAGLFAEDFAEGFPGVLVFHSFDGDYVVVGDSRAGYGQDGRDGQGFLELRAGVGQGHGGAFVGVEAFDHRFGALHVE